MYEYEKIKNRVATNSDIKGAVIEYLLDTYAEPGDYYITTPKVTSFTIKNSRGALAQIRTETTEDDDEIRLTLQVSNQKSSNLLTVSLADPESLEKLEQLIKNQQTK